jgi:catechol 2,3-dioxygenase-like lactoylglutathione lyase family enzyme
VITGIDHLVVLCASIEEGRAAYESLLGRSIDWQSLDADGMASVFFQLDGIALELIAPHVEGELANRLRSRLSDQGPGLQSIVFSSDAIEEDRKVFERRALNPDAILTGESADLKSGNIRDWRRFRIADAHSNGVRLFVLQRSTGDPLQMKEPATNALLGIDHLVIATANPDRAMALYGAKLGLRLTLDISSIERDMRLVSFKAGSARIELSHRISKQSNTEPDTLWGITWRTTDIEAAHERMHSQGLNVSEVRKGMSKATRVFTVRDGTLNVPTLVLAVEGDTKINKQ